MGTCSSNQVDKNIKSQSRPGHFTTVATNVSPNGITPRVGFVIKTNCSYKSKVFINLFYHEFVKEMCVISASKSYDKKGESCFVYGIIVPYALYTSNCQTNALRVQVCYYFDCI